MRVADCHNIVVAGSLLVFLALARISAAGAAPSPVLQLFTTVTWEASPSQEVTGYAVYYQVANLPVTNRVDVGRTLSVSISLLVGAVHSIYAVAYTADGVESEPSNVVTYTPPPITPVKLSKQVDDAVELRFRTSPLAFCWVEWTPTLNAPVWRVLGLGPFVADGNGDVVLSDPDAIQSPSRFYRAAKF